MSAHSYLHIAAKCTRFITYVTCPYSGTYLCIYPMQNVHTRTPMPHDHPPTFTFANCIHLNTYATFPHSELYFSKFFRASTLMPHFHTQTFIFAKHSRFNHPGRMSTLGYLTFAHCSHLNTYATCPNSYLFPQSVYS